MALLLLGERKLNEQEQSHIYVALCELQKALGKQLKGAQTLRLQTDSIEEIIGLNGVLRRMFNPSATEGEDTDERQLDIEDEIEGVETGGRTRLDVSTPARMTAEQLRDLLYEVGFAIFLADIGAESVTDAQRDEVESWLGQIAAAATVGGMIPDEPFLVAEFAMPIDRVKELLAAGPHAIRLNADEVAEIITPDGTVVDTIADPLDADLVAARRNLTVIRNSDITPDEIERYAFLGPWGPVDDGDGRYAIEAGGQTECCTDLDDAMARSARYNRALATKGAQSPDGWTEPMPVRVTDNDVQEVRAATESAE